MKLKEVREMIMNKSEQAAKDIIQENGFEILSESNDSFEYSNGATFSWLAMMTMEFGIAIGFALLRSIGRMNKRGLALFFIWIEF